MLSFVLVWRYMEKLKKLEELFLPVLEEMNVRLYELKWIGGKDKTLQAAIMDQNGKMDLDTCVAVSEKLSEILDREDLINEEYTLEVCSPGAEREIKDINELDSMQGAYIYVRLKEPFKKMMELTGEILSVEDGTIKLSYRDKAATRTAEFTKDNIEFARMAVRI